MRKKTLKKQANKLLCKFRPTFPRLTRIKTISVNPITNHWLPHRCYNVTWASMKPHKVFSHVCSAWEVSNPGILLCFLELKQLSCGLKLYVDKGNWRELSHVVEIGYSLGSKHGLCAFYEHYRVNDNHCTWLFRTFSIFITSYIHTGFFYCFPNGISIFKWLETDLKSWDTKTAYDHLVTENACT